MKKEKSYICAYKLGHPSFFKGMGSVLSLAGNYYKVLITHPEDDAKAIESDWSVVGYEILDSKKKLEHYAK